MNIAVIIARGGSKRIPRKNIKLFDDIPIIAYSIKTAIKSKLFDRVIVSTDDDEIAHIAKQYQAEIPFIRSAELADDYASTVDVMSDAVKQLDLTPQDLVCCIYATAPFLKSTDLQKGAQLLEDKNTEVVFAASSYPFPVQRAITIDDNNKVTMLHPEHLMTRSQDLEETYHDAGQFYFSSAEYFRNKHPLFSDQSKVVLIPSYRVVDIDTAQDWVRAELMFQLLKQDKYDEHSC